VLVSQIWLTRLNSLPTEEQNAAALARENHGRLTVVSLQAYGWARPTMYHQNGTLP
jgi:hypothetical protein